MLHKKGRKNKLSYVEEEISDGDDSSEWIMSYADTVTLLLCFFIIFFAEQSKKTESEIIIQLSKKLQKQSNPSEDSKKEKVTKAAMLNQIESEVRSELAQFKTKKVNLGIHKRQRELLLRLYERDFFHVGDYSLKDNGLEILKSVASLLEPFQDKILIKIEGHSDSLSVSKRSAYKTNLNLSSLRASAAADILISSNIREERLRVVGYGAAHKLVPDRTPSSLEHPDGKYLPEKGLKNRRIEIRVQPTDLEADKYLDLKF